MQYKFSYQIPTRHFIDVNFCLDAPNLEKQKIMLPFWRPGRYEKGDFAKKIQEFKVYNEEGKSLAFEKVASHEWMVSTKGAKKLFVDYNFYAADLNAGSTYVDKGFLYVNPVNLCLYAPDRMQETCILDVQTEEGLKPHGALPNKTSGGYEFRDFHHLADTPFFYAKDTSTLSFTSAGKEIYLHFWGYYKMDEQKVLRDTKRYVDFCNKLFPELPFPEYHFLYLCLPNGFHHGVEHQYSTVIALGPGYDMLQHDYNEFLSISCHEYYHAWNVKSIRPIEFWPYRYNEESYSNLGYLCEGVTTYMGNHLLFQSGVWEFPQYAKELEKHLERHYHNFGRFNKSLAESSFDTWLDGYERGIPDRKVSIYNEGALLTMALDAKIREKHEGKQSIHDVMMALYNNFYLKGNGVSEDDYWNTIAEFAGEEVHDIRKDFVAQAADLSAIVLEAFDYFGLEVDTIPSKAYHEAALGMKLHHHHGDGHQWTVTHLYPGSPAETRGICVGDVLVAVNEIQAAGDFAKWIEFFQDNQMTFTVQRNHFTKQVQLSASEKVYYKDYKVSRLEHPSRAQREAYNKWSFKSNHK